MKFFGFRTFLVLTASLIALGAIGSTSVANATKEIKYVPKPSSYDTLPAVKKGGTIYLHLGNNPKVINPFLADDNISMSLVPFLFASLFTDDSETLEPLPYLADTFTISPDKKEYTFVLNKIAKWQDGTPVTTDDVKFSFDTLMDPKTESAALRSYWQNVTIEVKDKQTFTFKTPAPKFDSLRQMYLFPVMQKAQFVNEKNFNKSKGILNPVSAGPYVFKSFSRDQKLELERNKDWWGYQLPHMRSRWNFDKIVFRITNDTNLQYEKWLKGDLDFMYYGESGWEIFSRKVRGTDKDKIGENMQTPKKLWATQIENSAPRPYSYVGWNLRRPIFASKKTRQALAHLADVKELSEKVAFGFAAQSTSSFGSLTMNSAPDLRQPGKMIAYDPKKAIQMLKEDGWADTDKDNILDKEFEITDSKGNKTKQRLPFKFVLKHNTGNIMRGKIAQILQQSFKKAGIDFEIRSMEWNAFLGDIDNREFDAIVMGWTGVPFPNARQIWHSESEKNQGSNFGGYSNKTVDELIDKSNVEFDLAKRAKVMQEINRILYDEQPYLWLLETRYALVSFSKRITSSKWLMKYDAEPMWGIDQHPVSMYSAQ